MTDRLFHRIEMPEEPIQPVQQSSEFRFNIDQGASIHGMEFQQFIDNNARANEMRNNSLQELSQNIRGGSELFQQLDNRHQEVRHHVKQHVEKISDDLHVIEVTPQTRHIAEARMRKFLGNDPYNLRANFDLKDGDRVVFNRSIDSMNIIHGGTRIFGRRNLPNTPDEIKTYEQWARELHDKNRQMRQQQNYDVFSWIQNSSQVVPFFPNNIQWQTPQNIPFSVQGNLNENLQQTPNENADISQWKILGDWIVRRGEYPGAKNSCGQSVGELLNQFGLRNVLPQSGRHGRNWDTILETYPASQYFTKIPVDHPDDAPAGSVVVFDEWAQSGSRARKQYGHVEIKGSNGMYYSYYDSVNAGGSARSSTKRGDEYRRYTGFTGYAYVYNGKLHA